VYDITVEAEGYEKGTRNDIEIKAGESEPLSIILQKVIYDITITVEDSEGEKVELANVFLNNQSEGVTNIDGVILIHVYFGEHEIRVLKDGYNPETITLDVPKKMKYNCQLKPLKVPFEQIFRFAPYILGIFLLALLVRMNRTLKKANKKFDTATEKQEITLKENKKDINTMKEYLTGILEET
jgi:hypothetical protein